MWRRLQPYVARLAAQRGAALPVAAAALRLRVVDLLDDVTHDGAAVGGGGRRVGRSAVALDRETRRAR